MACIGFALFKEKLWKTSSVGVVGKTVFFESLQKLLPEGPFKEILLGEGCSNSGVVVLNC